ncbi:sigma-w pathway protein ysdB [Anaerobacillus isosaccharinicus]|uniref:Sigma-w pathway protein ysdB n=1 Tax=Anaerobacillus isosaccharinicus TaxID=1532552 RepID=A0A1S2ME60_9BACI|nr:sigma-w pathway protein ysdB [Anaerobacillus isosaccharinicus]MBA5587903.1 sigma-w pathway protein ysdB [Anaerobacillus isosaccharinicus]QOY33946.1 sigma-w pathway protein ysdB [Anaerobacillus isosaccharinicus]
MAVFLFRILILAAVFILAYSAIKYFVNPKRKLELAHEKKLFYFLDDKQNVRKNFLITYRGVLFEGEKYLGTTESAFEVVSVQVWARNTDKLQGLNKEDFYFIEKEILVAYPNTKVEWKNPINNLLR